MTLPLVGPLLDNKILILILSLIDIVLYEIYSDDNLTFPNSFDK